MARYCSPLLVNAICALRSVCHGCAMGSVHLLTEPQFTCAKIRVFGLLTGQTMVETFFNEARALLDSEGARPSLPTAQSLYILYRVCVCLAKDRAGLMYRSMAIEILKRLNLEDRFDSLTDTSSMAEAQERRAISKAVWGHFCFERYVPQSSLQLTGV
jgi:hypothetical protein